jgi:hypothetical protein
MTKSALKFVERRVTALDDVESLKAATDFVAICDSGTRAPS